MLTLCGGDPQGHPRLKVNMTKLITEHTQVLQAIQNALNPK